MKVGGQAPITERIIGGLPGLRAGVALMTLTQSLLATAASTLIATAAVAEAPGLDVDLRLALTEARLAPERHRGGGDRPLAAGRSGGASPGGTGFRDAGHTEHPLGRGRRGAVGRLDPGDDGGARHPRGGAGRRGADRHRHLVPRLPHGDATRIGAPSGSGSSRRITYYESRFQPEVVGGRSFYGLMQNLTRPPPAASAAAPIPGRSFRTARPTCPARCGSWPTWCRTTGRSPQAGRGWRRSGGR